MHREVKINKVFLKADAEVEEKPADAIPFRFLYCKKLGIIFTRGLVTKPTRCQRPANFFDQLDAAENSNLKEPRVLFDSGLAEPPVGNLLLSVQTCFPRGSET